MNISYSLNVGGKLLDLSCPVVMGIVNATPDSFYTPSRIETAGELSARLSSMRADGMSIVDVGACSTRPGVTFASKSEEMDRLRSFLPHLMCEADGLVVSVDTFRADVAKMCVEEYGVHIINDISGGLLDERMFSTIARLGVPYVLSHYRGGERNVSPSATNADITAEVVEWLAHRVDQLRDLGQTDIILDPGFGFTKTLEENFILLGELDALQMLRLPVLVGVSRKSMATKPLQITPDESLIPTTVLNTLALERHASILRVHDVKAAAQAIKLFQQIKKPIHAD